jgi:hypothetical protein
MKAEPVRGFGRTSRQIRSAPSGAVYVFPGRADYAQRLAGHLDRADLIIVPVAFESVFRAVVGTRRQIVFDHAFFDLDSRDSQVRQVFDLACHQQASAAPNLVRPC